MTTSPGAGALRATPPEPKAAAGQWVAEARSMIDDLFEPKPVLYWIDFLLSMLVGSLCFLVAQWAGRRSAGGLVLLLPTALAFYRASAFTHELTHLPRDAFRGFRSAWNLLCGIPFLMPSFLYHTHTTHHLRRHYGTDDDGEYIPFARLPRRHILAYFAQAPVIPFVAVLRFSVLTPAAWISSQVRAVVARHASSMVIDPSFLRPLPHAGEVWIWRFQELACFVYLIGIGVLVVRGTLPTSMLLSVYLTVVTMLLLNAARTLVAHRYRHIGGEMSHLEQVLDSLNYPRHPWLTGLWAPVGLRFHALHHLFPSLPYHALALAHRRLIAQLPSDSPYRSTERPGFGAAFRETWVSARAAERHADTSGRVPPPTPE